MKISISNVYSLLNSIESGALIVGSNNVQIDVSDSIFNYNDRNVYMINGGILNIDHSFFSLTYGTDSSNAVIGRYGCAAGGMVIEGNNTSVNISDSKFYYNIADNGAAIGLRNGANLYIENTQFVNNFATTKGGVICANHWNEIELVNVDIIQGSYGNETSDGQIGMCVLLCVCVCGWVGGWVGSECGVCCFERRERGRRRGLQQKRKTQTHTHTHTKMKFGK